MLTKKSKCNGTCLKQDKTTCNHGTIVKTDIVYKLSSNLNNFDLENCLFGAVELTKNADIQKLKILRIWRTLNIFIS